MQHSEIDVVLDEKGGDGEMLAVVETEVVNLPAFCAEYESKVMPLKIRQAAHTTLSASVDGSCAAVAVAVAVVVFTAKGRHDVWHHTAHEGVSSFE
jgi:hypothetical protein